MKRLCKNCMRPFHVSDTDKYRVCPDCMDIRFGDTVRQFQKPPKNLEVWGTNSQGKHHKNDKAKW
jgi:hypothetical protein